MLAGSACFILAVDNETGNAAGFVTALTDGVLSAYLPLLEVLPSYRGRGIGTELVRRILAKLGGLYMVDLTCDPALESFYARFGMRPANAMILRHPARIPSAGNANPPL